MPLSSRPSPPGPPAGQVHVHRRVSRGLFVLRTDGSTSAASLARAAEELLAAQYERVAMRWNYFLFELEDHLAALVGDEVWEERSAAERAGAAAARTLYLALRSDEWRASVQQRRELFGAFPSDDTLCNRLEQQLEERAELRTLEMQSARPPEGGLYHMCMDDNDKIANAANVLGNASTRKLHLTASADNRAPCVLRRAAATTLVAPPADRPTTILPSILTLAPSSRCSLCRSAVLIPNAKKESWLPSLVAVKEQFGEPSIIAKDNFPTDANIVQAVMPNATRSLDLNHAQKRTTSTFRPCAAPHARLPLAPSHGVQLEPTPHATPPFARRTSSKRPALLARWKRMFLRNRQRGPHSIEMVKERMRSGLKTGAKVMIERGRHGVPPKFFVFKDEVSESSGGCSGSPTDPPAPRTPRCAACCAPHA